MCRQRSDVVIVLDQSTSIVAEDYDNWFEFMLGFAVNISRAFEVGPHATQIGLLKFSDQIDVGFYLDEHSNNTAVVDAILVLDIDGGDTNIAEALERTRNEMFSPKHGARSNVSRILFLITDGSPTVDTHRTVPEASTTKDAGIEIFVVGVTSQVRRSVLEPIASVPLDTHMYFVDTFDRLGSILRTLVNVSCGTTPLSTASTTTPTTTTSTTTTTTTTTVPTTTPSEFTSAVEVVVVVVKRLGAYSC